MNAEGTGIVLVTTLSDVPSATIRGNIIGIDATVDASAAERNRASSLRSRDHAAPDRRQRRGRRQHHQRQRECRDLRRRRGDPHRHPGQHHRHRRERRPGNLGNRAGGIVVGDVHDGSRRAHRRRRPRRGQRHRLQRRPRRLVSGRAWRSSASRVNRVTVRGNRIYGNASRGFAPDCGGADAQRPGRRRHGANNLQNIADHHGRRLRPADRRARDAQQHAVDDLRRRLLRETRVRSRARRPRPQGQDYVGTTQVTTNASGDRHDRLPACRRR